MRTKVRYCCSCDICSMYHTWTSRVSACWLVSFSAGFRPAETHYCTVSTSMRWSRLVGRRDNAGRRGRTPQESIKYFLVQFVFTRRSRRNCVRMGCFDSCLVSRQVFLSRYLRIAPTGSTLAPSLLFCAPIPLHSARADHQVPQGHRLRVPPLPFPPWNRHRHVRRAKVAQAEKQGELQLAGYLVAILWESCSHARC